MALVCVFDDANEAVEYFAKVNVMNQIISGKEAHPDEIFTAAGIVTIEEVGNGLLFTAVKADALQHRAHASLGPLGGGMVLFDSVDDASARGAKVTTTIRAADAPSTPETEDAVFAAAAAAAGEPVIEGWRDHIESFSKQIVAFLASGTHVAWRLSVATAHAAFCVCVRVTGGAAGGGHGHSHGGAPCHGHGAPAHGHSHAAPPAAASHGHSHGGEPCGGHGHSHAAPAPAPAPATSHGHSHGGKACGGHGH